MGRALVTDLYELTMAASYLRRGMVAPATFSLFVRDLPVDRGFLVAAGLEACLEYLENFSFEEEDLDWLAAHALDAPAVDALRALRFDGDVVAVPEGRVVFAGEPLLEVTASLPVAQVVETYLLNQVTFQTAVATKAARCRLAAAGRLDVVDFSLRRTHGAEAGHAVARLSAIAGFSGTSNVEAARRYGLRAVGTMAHSYVAAYPSELEAFRAYARDFPERTTFLVDTYDTLQGVRNAITVIREQGMAGPLAVRLDSGDLVALSRRVRHLLDEAGLGRVRIIVSGGLDEFDIERLVAEAAPVDAAGVGTRMGVSADAPYVDSVYKLVALDSRPVLKLSPGKSTLPLPKQVWRRFPIDRDWLAGREEAGPEGYEPLLLPVMRAGARLGPPATVEAARARLERDLGGLPAAARSLGDPEAPPVRVSERLSALAARLERGLVAGAGARGKTSAMAKITGLEDEDITTITAMPGEQAAVGDDTGDDAGADDTGDDAGADDTGDDAGADDSGDDA